jgi:hypothetical protein
MIRLGVSNDTLLVCDYLLEGFRIYLPGPKKIMILVAHFNPVFIFRSSPTSAFAEMFELD